MRLLKWTLLTVFLVGCGSGTTASKTKSPSPPNSIAVPTEVAALFERGELNQAIDKLTEMIAAKPRDPNLHSLRASAYHRRGKIREALADFDQAIALNDQDASLYNNRGFIHLGTDSLDAALADFNNATLLDPKNMNAFNNRGLLFIAQKKYDEAIKQFNLAIGIDNRYVDAYNNRGFAEFELGSIEQALDDFNLAISIDSNYVNAYNNRGLLRARAGDYENAVVDFTHAMMIDPLNPAYYDRRREVYRRLGAQARAMADERKLQWLIEYHEITAEINNSSNPAHELTQRARHFMRVNDEENAMRDLEQALATDPQSAETLVVRATLLLQQRLLAEAKTEALAALAIEPSQEAYSVLGDVYLRQRDYDQAIENYSLAHRVDQDVARAYYAKAKLLEDQGQSDLAKVNFQQAMTLDPDLESRLR